MDCTALKVERDVNSEEDTDITDLFLEIRVWVLTLQAISPLFAIKILSKV